MKSFITSLSFVLMSLISFGQTITDIVVASPDHTILETAVIAAELNDELAAPGTLTLFAPTDAAFAALPPGTLSQLLMDPTGDLAQILLYHVLGITVNSNQLTDGQMATTLQGKDITVTINGSDVFINNALVTMADIPASNGVVHVIDAVLIPPYSVVDVIVESPDHTILETAVIAAELADDLSGDGPFTVFAPTDAAFNALPAGVLDALLMDPTGALANILLYHVLGDEVLSTELSDGQMAMTLQGKDITVTIDGTDVFINDAQVTVADIQADNGVVHVIDAVLVPPFTVVDVIVESPDHTILETAVIAAELADDLSGDGPFTVFAPTDAAFNALPAGVLDALLMDPTGALANVLLYHVLGDEVLSTELSDGQMAMTLQGKDITVTIDGTDVFINDAQVTVADIQADNGVVHVIDAVLVPPFTVVDVIVESPDHTILETAVIAAELADDLSGDGPFTVFAPTDDAFNDLPSGVLDDLLMDPTGDLAQILLYHVLGDEVLSTELSDGQTATTLQGAEVTVTIDGTDVFINDAQVTVADILADNGVVHVIDAVLLPPTSTQNLSASASNIDILPNPASNFINLNFPASMDDEKILQLFDMNGRLIDSKVETGFNTTWYLNNVQDGMYFLRIDTENQNYFEKVIINK